MIYEELRKHTKHHFIRLTDRGNTAIQGAVSLIKGTILIPEEGGWLEYEKIAHHQKVRCVDAVLDLDDLKQQLQKNPAALLYQNPAGYFAEQPMEEIYHLCHEHNCLVIIDVSGSIGTPLCNGQYADILVGSFGKWKLVEARAGGFISCHEQELFEKLAVPEFADAGSLQKIMQKLQELPSRIAFLDTKIQAIKNDLQAFDVIHPLDRSFVVVVRFHTEGEKETIINYCRTHRLEWTECPRYIRLNQKAISIEVKRL